MMDSKPPASSDEALEAFSREWMALMVATGWPLALIFATLCSTTASMVGIRLRALVNGAKSDTSAGVCFISCSQSLMVSLASLRRRMSRNNTWSGSCPD